MWVSIVVVFPQTFQSGNLISWVAKHEVSEVTNDVMEAEKGCLKGDIAVEGGGSRSEYQHSPTTSWQHVFTVT